MALKPTRELRMVPDQETHLNSDVGMLCVCHGGCLQIISASACELVPG